MQKHNVTVGARHLGLIAQAFANIQGDRGILLSYKFGRILEPVMKAQQTFIAAITPFVDAEGHLRTDLTDEERELVEVLVNEEITVEIPIVGLAEIALENRLRMTDDSILTYLVDIGILVE